jgi:hypothetical protein
VPVRAELHGIARRFDIDDRTLDTLAAASMSV